MVQAAKMRFILTGFTQDSGFRVFVFTRVGADQIRTEFTVKADLALSRIYDIRMQELPLLCCAFLERSDSGHCEGGQREGDGGEGDKDPRALTFSEEEMRVYARDRATAKEAAMAARKRPLRAPANASLGSAWRVPRP